MIEEGSDDPGVMLFVERINTLGFTIEPFSVAEEETRFDAAKSDLSIKTVAISEPGGIVPSRTWSRSR